MGPVFHSRKTSVL